MKQTFTEAVGAVSPLNGAIDGSVREKPRKPRKPAREPMDRSLTFFCSNPQCNHATWSPQDQARHMAREFWEAAAALVRLAPESDEALKLTGGVILRDLTNDECREVWRQYDHGKRRAAEMPIRDRLILREFIRRRRAGTLPRISPEEAAARKVELNNQARSDLADLPDRELRAALREYNRLMRNEQPIPDDIRRLANEYRRRSALGILKHLTPQERAAQRMDAVSSMQRFNAERKEKRRLAWPASQVKELRNRSGLSQAEFGKRLGLSKTAVQSWESGHVVPSNDAIARLDSFARSRSSALARTCGAAPPWARQT